jgi:hypothetical protein
MAGVSSARNRMRDSDLWHPQTNAEVVGVRRLLNTVHL